MEFILNKVKEKDIMSLGFYDIFEIFFRLLNGKNGFLFVLVIVFWGVVIVVESYF